MVIGDDDMAIVGVSASPIQGGNTDRLVQALLERSGHEYVFVNLSTLSFAPCRACAHLCAETNSCAHKDDLWPHLEQILDAAPVLIAIACRRVEELQREVLADNAEGVSGNKISAAMAAQNLMLAAHALGLGTCCYTGPLAARKELEELLGFRRRHTLVCLVAVGVPDETPKAPARKPLKYISRFEE